MQIESSRTTLESFEQSLNRELYEYFSGLKDRLELTSVYSDYSDFLSVESLREVQVELEHTEASFSSRQKSLVKIHQYLIDQHLDYRVASLTQELERFEAQQTFPWEGKTLDLSQVSGLLRNEADASKRRSLGKRSAAFGEADALRQQKISQLHKTAGDLGFRNYVVAREYIAGVDYRSLLEELNSALSYLDDSYLGRMRVSIEATLGIPLQDAGSWDVPRWRMLNDQTKIFPANNLMPVIDFFISDLGIRPERADAVSVDLNPKAKRLSGAFCIPIRVPHEIRIVARAEHGVGCHAALMHEMGHACHFAWTDASLPAEHRLWGDRAVSESYAFLFEHFLLEPEWLARTLSFTQSKQFLQFQFLYKAYLVRRCAGILCFALRLHGGAPFDDIPQIYAETMKTYTGLRHPPESWAKGLADGFEAADYLRGWILERLLREYISTKYGKMPNKRSSGFLKELWETGHLYSAEELCRETGMGSLEPQMLADELSGGLQY